MLKEHGGCGQKTDFDENDETRKNYVTTWEVCWSLCQTSEGTSLEGKQHRVQEKFLDFKSFCSLKIGTEAVPPQLLFTGWWHFDIDFQVSGQVCENRNNIKSRTT